MRLLTVVEMILLKSRSKFNFPVESSISFLLKLNSPINRFGEIIGLI